jgi:hypothetical protein
LHRFSSKSRGDMPEHGDASKQETERPAPGKWMHEA